MIIQSTRHKLAVNVGRGEFAYHMILFQKTATPTCVSAAILPAVLQEELVTFFFRVKSGQKGFLGNRNTF